MDAARLPGIIREASMTRRLPKNRSAVLCCTTSGHWIRTAAIPSIRRLRAKCVCACGDGDKTSDSSGNYEVSSPATPLADGFANVPAGGDRSKRRSEGTPAPPKS